MSQEDVLKYQLCALGIIIDESSHLYVGIVCVQLSHNNNNKNNLTGGISVARNNKLISVMDDQNIIELRTIIALHN